MRSMFRPLSFYVGLRYTGARARNSFISVITLISALGLMLGVAVLITVLSVMNGFDRELQTRILGMVTHLSVQGREPVQDWQALAGRLDHHDEIEAVAPFVELEGMLSHRGNVAGAMINGIEPRAERKVSIVGDYMEEGELEQLAPGEFDMVLGYGLARRLGADVGDKVTLVLPEATISPAGVMPRFKRFTVTGIFRVRAEVDSLYAYINVQDAAKLARQAGTVQGVRLKLDDLFSAPAMGWTLQQELGPNYYTRDWTRSHGNLFQAIKMEKTMIGLLLMLIVAVAAFNIISTLVMVVTDKKADIAILRTLGATPGAIMGIFMVQGSLIGVVGTLSGGILGVLAALNVSEMVAWLERVLGIQFLSSDVYFISYLPSQLIWSDVVVICVTALSLSFLATLYPAWRASRTEPAEALRYD